MKTILRLSLFLSLVQYSGTLYCQPVGQVWSKNMELLNAVDVGGINAEQMRFHEINGNYFIIVPSTLDQNIKIVDVSDPRNATVVKTLEITGASYQGQTSLSNGDLPIWSNAANKIDQDFVELYTAPGTSGHTYAYVFVGTVQVGASPDVYARYLIYDISVALQQTGTNLTASATAFSTASGSWYVGYIEQDFTYLIHYDANTNHKFRQPIGGHTLSIEPNQGILIISPLALSIFQSSCGGSVTSANIDLFSLSNPADPTRITESKTCTDGANQTFTEYRPIELKQDILAPFGAHETYAEDISSGSTKKLRLTTAAFEGGVTINEVDFTDVQNATVTSVQQWLYNNDRKHPDIARVSEDATLMGSLTDQTEKSYSLRNTHTAEPVTIADGTRFLLTTDELPGVYYVSNNSSFEDFNFTTSSTSCPASTQIFLNHRHTYNHNGEDFYYVWGDPDVYYPGCLDQNATTGYRDNRRPGWYLRAWQLSSNGAIVGSNNNSNNGGPIGAYDVPEQTVNDKSSGVNNSVLGVAGIVPVNATTSSTDHAPNVIHRFVSIPNTDQIFVAYYAQGTRILDLKYLASTGNVKERAFYDNTATMNYAFPAYPAVASHQFYENQDDWSKVFTRSYYTGVEDVRPDSRVNVNDSWIYGDERFIYSQGVTYSTPGVSDGIQRIFIQRYFDDKIGGTISGWNGTPNGDQGVNLQGIFTAERDVTVAPGATVTLWGGTTSDPTALVQVSGQSKSILVQGELDVELKNGGTAYDATAKTGGDIICTNITVSSNGILRVKTGADARFAADVTIQDGGQWIIEPNATVRIGNHTYTSAGDITFSGVSSGSAQLSSVLHYETASDGSVAATLVLGGLFGNKQLSVHTKASVNFDCNVVIQSDAKWNVSSGSRVGLRHDRWYGISGTLQATGTSGTGNLAIFDEISHLTPNNSNGHSGYYPALSCESAQNVDLEYGQFNRVSISGTGCGDWATTCKVWHCSFSAPQDGGFGCVVWVDPHGSVSILNNTFQGNGNPQLSHTSECAIGVYDDPLGSADVESNTVQNFQTGIGFYNAGLKVINNSISNCFKGIVASGPWMPPMTQFSTNAITGVPTKKGTGIWCEMSASPHVFANVISAAHEGVYVEQSFPMLSCNHIYHNTDGIQSFLNSQPDLQGPWHGKNFIYENDNSQIWCLTSVPLLDLGHNEIMDNRSTNINLIKGNLATGQLWATHNFWGNAGTGGTCNVNAICTSGPKLRSDFCFVWCQDDGAAPSSTCSLSAIPECSQYPDPSTDELSIDPCQYWIDKYNHDMACGICENDGPLNDLKNAIANCQSGTPQGNDPDGTLIKLLGQLLGANVSCHQRDMPSLAILEAYYDSVSHTLNSSAKKRAAKMMQAQTWGAAQYFDNAKAISDSLAGTTSDTNEIQMDTTFSQLMSYLKSVEGGNTGGFSKQVMAYKGRADMQPVGIDLLGLTASPNPFANQQVDVRYILPVDDATDITLIKVVDVLGHDVTTLVHDVQAAGPHLVSFSGTDLPAGQFIVAVMTHNHVSSRLVIRLK